MGLHIINVIATILLLLAAFPLQYDYYNFLRIFISVASLINVLIHYQTKKYFWICFFCATLIMFNPIFPIFLTKEIWIVIDIATAILFLLHSILYIEGSEKFSRIFGMILIILFVIGAVSRNIFIFLPPVLIFIILIFYNEWKQKLTFRIEEWYTGWKRNFWVNLKTDFQAIGCLLIGALVFYLLLALYSLISGKLG